MRDRIISAVILIALFALFYFLGGVYFVGFTSFAAIFAYKEIAFLKYSRDNGFRKKNNE